MLIIHARGEEGQNEDQGSGGKERVDRGPRTKVVSQLGSSLRLELGQDDLEDE